MSKKLVSARSRRNPEISSTDARSRSSSDAAVRRFEAAFDRVLLSYFDKPLLPVEPGSPQRSPLALEFLRLLAEFWQKKLNFYDKHSSFPKGSDEARRLAYEEFKDAFFYAYKRYSGEFDPLVLYRIFETWVAASSVPELLPPSLREIVSSPGCCRVRERNHALWQRSSQSWELIERLVQRFERQFGEGRMSADRARFLVFVLSCQGPGRKVRLPERPIASHELSLYLDADEWSFFVGVVLEGVAHTKHGKLYTVRRAEPLCAILEPQPGWMNPEERAAFVRERGAPLGWSPLAYTLHDLEGINLSVKSALVAGSWPLVGVPLPHGDKRPVAAALVAHEWFGEQQAKQLVGLRSSDRLAFDSERFRRRCQRLGASEFCNLCGLPIDSGSRVSRVAIQLESVGAADDAVVSFDPYFYGDSFAKRLREQLKALGLFTG